jgi:hypothetical protein
MFIVFPNNWHEGFFPLSASLPTAKCGVRVLRLYLKGRAKKSITRQSSQRSRCAEFKYSVYKNLASRKDSFSPTPTTTRLLFESRFGSQFSVLNPTFVVSYRIVLQLCLSSTSGKFSISSFAVFVDTHHLLQKFELEHDGRHPP